MQVENHKEEVPFGHYEELFRKANAEEMAARTGAKWDGKEFYVNLLGAEYAISHPVYDIRKCAQGERIATSSKHEMQYSISSEQEISSASRHLLFPTKQALRGPQEEAALAMTPHPSPAATPSPQGEGLGAPVLPVQTFLLRYLLESKQVPWQGGWKTFREMPWGELYITPYTGRVLTRAAFTFGTRLSAFKTACEKMGALPLNHGDAGYQFDLIGGYSMQIMVWEGDDEFPPNAQVLYSDNFENGFAPEDRVVAGDILISTIKGNM